MLPGFVRPESVARLVAEARALAPLAHRSGKRHDPYFTADDPAWPPGHPRRTFVRRTNGFVCYDLLPGVSDLRALFDREPMAAVVRRAFGERRLHRYADPLAAMPINTMRPGDAFPWHFDSNEFTVAVVVQSAEAGGGFEYAPNLRAPGDERNVDVAAVLAGDDSRVRRLALAPGDVKLFRGHYTLHRVTRVRGGRDRHVGAEEFQAVIRQPGASHLPGTGVGVGAAETVPRDRGRRSRAPEDVPVGRSPGRSGSRLVVHRPIAADLSPVPAQCPGGGAVGPARTRRDAQSSSLAAAEDDRLPARWRRRPGTGVPGASTRTAVAEVSEGSRRNAPGSGSRPGLARNPRPIDGAGRLAMAQSKRKLRPAVMVGSVGARRGR